MSKIGYLKPVSNENVRELYGEIKTLQLQLQLNLVPVPNKSNFNAPDYNIYANSDIEVGSAWIKQKQLTDGSVIDFLSITIDDPSMPSALNVAAFKLDSGLYEISWRRRQANQNDNG